MSAEFQINSSTDGKVRIRLVSAESGDRFASVVLTATQAKEAGEKLFQAGCDAQAQIAS